MIFYDFLWIFFSITYSKLLSKTTWVAAAWLISGVVFFFSSTGERIQIHKNGAEYKCYSRNLKPIMEWKVADVREYVPKVSHIYAHTFTHSRTHARLHTHSRTHARTLSCLLARAQACTQLQYSTQKIQILIIAILFLKATTAKQVILDGEILLMDNATRKPLPFGTLGIHKKTNFKEATVCVFLFDILFLDGKSLLDESVQKRREV